MSMRKWGFLREDCLKAANAGTDLQTGLPRTGLEEYLKVIFPNVNDWIHDKTTGLKEENEKTSLRRPDWRSESLKLIIEFDGIHHYRNPKQILKDEESNLFGVNVEQQLFDNNIPSLGIEEDGAPACLCPSGIKRMAEDFYKFPQQYKVNIENLRKVDNEFLSGCSLLETEYNKIKNR